MATENVQKIEKVADLGNNITIWKVHIDALREQDKNARVMPIDKFDRLSANIGKDKRLESLPLVTPSEDAEGNKTFLLISGHHRTRAARAAGMEFVHVMSIDEKLTHDQIRAKQLAHNALSGFDNPEILAELYGEIDDINEKLASGITDMDFQIDVPQVGTDDVEVHFDFELLNILFMPKQANRFDEILELIDPSAKLYIADKADFERMKNAIQEISKRDNVRNISAILARMLDIVEQYHKDVPPPEPEKDKGKGKQNGKAQKGSD